MKYNYLKKLAKKNIKRHYFRNILVAFIATIILTGGYTYTTNKVLDNENFRTVINDKKTKKTNAEVIKEILVVTDEEKNKAQEKLQKKSSKYTSGVIAALINETTKSGSIIFGVINAINIYLFNNKISTLILQGLYLIILFLFFVLVENVIVVGRNRYFLEQRRYDKTKIDKLLFPYRIRKTRHVAYILFTKYLYSFLWNFTIIGGFIKHYEYILIPYLLAENPNMSKKEAFKMSKELMMGEKFELFKLDISLLGWKILEIFTFNLSTLFFYDAYKNSLYAEIYMKIRNNKKATVTNSYLLNDKYLDIPDIKNESYHEDKFSIPLKKYRKWLKIDYNKDYTLLTYILFFFTFSICGWLWEVFYHFFNTGIFVNRGTMYGPWLPIYGYGGVLILFLLKPFRKNPWLLFILAFILCGILEYSTAWYLETFKHTSWWNYNGFFLNIKGRVCLEGLLLFGFGGCMFTYFIAPILDNIYKNIKKNIKIILCIILVFVYLGDLLYTSNHPHTGKGIATNLKQ